MMHPDSHEYFQVGTETPAKGTTVKSKHGGSPTAKGTYVTDLDFNEHHGMPDNTDNQMIVHVNPAAGEYKSGMKKGY